MKTSSGGQQRIRRCAFSLLCDLNNLFKFHYWSVPESWVQNNSELQESFRNHTNPVRFWGTFKYVFIRKITTTTKLKYVNLQKCLPCHRSHWWLYEQIWMLLSALLDTHDDNLVKQKYCTTKNQQFAFYAQPAIPFYKSEIYTVSHLMLLVRLIFHSHRFSKPPAQTIFKL